MQFVSLVNADATIRMSLVGIGFPIDADIVKKNEMYRRGHIPQFYYYPGRISNYLEADQPVPQDTIVVAVAGASAGFVAVDAEFARLAAALSK